MQDSITKKTISGLKWSYMSTIITAIMQIGYTAIMSRLLTPKDFGLVAMGGVLLRFGQYFSQMGLGSALIQKNDISEKEIVATYTFSLILGLIFTLLSFFMAPLGGYIFNDSEIVKIIPIMGLTFVISGFSLTSFGLLRKEMKFKKIAFIDIFSFTFGYMIIGVTSAVFNNGIWSLIMASLSQNLISSILYYFFRRHPLKFCFEIMPYKNLFSFGAKVSLIGFLEYINGSLDTFIIGRYLGAKSIGIYNRAYMLINLPMQYFTSSMSKVLFPAFSEIQNESNRLKNNIKRILKLSSFVLFYIASLYVVFADTIVNLILGNQWKEAIPIVRILAVASAFNLINHFIGILFEAKGWLLSKINMQIISILISIVCIFLLFRFEIFGVAVAILVSRILYFLIYINYLVKYLGSPRDFILDQILPIFIVVVSFLFIFLSDGITTLSTFILFVIFSFLLLFSSHFKDLKNFLLKHVYIKS